MRARLSKFIAFNLLRNPIKLTPTLRFVGSQEIRHPALHLDSESSVVSHHDTLQLGLERIDSVRVCSKFR